MCRDCGVVPNCVIWLMFVVSGWLFFFFKQKTAYEMRISDWSSDVCSSDVLARQQPHFPTEAALAGHDVLLGAALDQIGRKAGIRRRERAVGGGAPAIFGAHRGDRSDQPRSEEHTSELQSLMRISYAVFCLKKKKTNKTALKQYMRY